VTVDFLAGLAARAAAFTVADAAVTRHCFRALLAGHPASVAGLASAVGLPDQDVERAVAALAAAGTILIDGDAVTVAGGLSDSPTAHRVVLDGVTRHVCCAVDAIGIPAALGLIAHVESRCALCGAALTVGVDAGHVAAEPKSVVIWAADLDPTRSVREYT
jgi:alkylmercury lyase-like protein